MKLSQTQSTRTHRVLVFGAPKTGKSELAGKLAEHFNLIWVDMENGHEVLYKLPTAWQERIELIKLPDTRDFPIAIETCLKIVRGPVDICEQHGKVGCMICKKNSAEFTHLDISSLTSNDILVFDSLTQLSNSAIAHITKSEPDDYKLNYDDWGNLGKLLDIFLSSLQQAHYNVIVISHEIEAETEGKKKTLVPVGGTRNFSRNIAKYFDDVVYCEKKNKKHVFASSTTYATNILTGSRSDVVMESLEVPTLLSIFKPDVITSAPAASTSTKTNTKSTSSKGGESTKDILARLKANKA